MSLRDRTIVMLAGLRASYMGTAYVLAGQAGATIINLLSLLVVARAIGPSLYGSFAAVISFLGLFTIIADGGLNQYTIREAVHHPEQASSVYRNVLRLRLILALASTVVCVLAGLALRLPAPIFVLLLVSGTLLTSAWGTLFLSVFHVAQDFAVVARLRIFEAAVGGLAMVAAALIHPTITALAGAAVFTALLVSLMTYALGRRRANLAAALPTSLSFKPLRASIWFAATSVLWYAGSRASIALASWRLGPEALGSYAAGFRLADPVTYLATSLMVSQFPRVVAEHRDGSVALGAVVSRIGRMFVFGAFVAFAGFLLAPIILPAVLGARYASAVAVFQILIWSLPVALATVPTSLLADATGHQHIHFFNGIFLVAASVGLLLLLTPRFGATGPAWAVLGGQVVGAAIGIPAILFLTKKSGVLKGTS